MTDYIDCDGRDHALAVETWDDMPGVTVALFASAFYEQQESILGKLWRRVKAAVLMLAGKEYRYAELVLSQESARAMAAALMEANPNAD